MTSMREYIDVAPSNGSGTASYKDGNPIVNFIITLVVTLSVTYLRFASRLWQRKMPLRNR